MCFGGCSTCKSPLHKQRYKISHSSLSSSWKCQKQHPSTSGAISKWLIIFLIKLLQFPIGNPYVCLGKTVELLYEPACLESAVSVQIIRTSCEPGTWAKIWARFTKNLSNISAMNVYNRTRDERATHNTRYRNTTNATQNLQHRCATNARYRMYVCDEHAIQNTRARRAHDTEHET